MPDWSWTFELDDGQHTVEYVKGGFWRELLVKVDGIPLQDTQTGQKTGQLQVIFNIGKHRCLLRCLQFDGVWSWDLYVDGRLIY